MVGSRAAAEQPQVAGAGQVDRLVEGQLGSSFMEGVLSVKLWRVLGVAGLAGVAATGVIIARDQRHRAQLTPDEVRARLHERLDEGEPPAEP